MNHDEELKEFYVTSTITIEAKNREEADKMLKLEQSRTESEWADDLLTNAEIDEA